MLGAMLVLNHQSVFDLPALPENGPYKNCFWAPEIHKMRGRFYLVFTADN